jgi:hypothetical protein
MIISIPPHFAKIRKASTRRRRWFPPTHHNTDGNREDCPEKIIEIRLVSVIRCYKQNKDANPDEYKKISNTNYKFINHGGEKTLPLSGEGRFEPYLRRAIFLTGFFAVLFFDGVVLEAVFLASFLGAAFFALDAFFFTAGFPFAAGLISVRICSCM